MSLRNYLVEEVYLPCVPSSSGDNFLVELSNWRAKINTPGKKERLDVAFAHARSLYPLRN